MIDARQVALLERQAALYAAGVELSTDEQLNAAVQAQLDRIADPPVVKRQKTIRAYAEAEITPGALIKDVFRRKGVASQRIFYDQKKDWYHGRLFREVLENVRALYRKWDNTRETRELAERRREFNEAVFDLADLMRRKAIEMFSSELFEVVVTDEVALDENGEETIVRKITMVPSRWSMDTAVRAAKTAAELGHLALGMPTARSEASVKYEQNLPPGMTREQVEAARQALIEQMLSDIAESEDAAAEEEDEEE